MGAALHDASTVTDNTRQATEPSRGQQTLKSVDYGSLESKQECADAWGLRFDVPIQCLPLLFALSCFLTVVRALSVKLSTSLAVSLVAEKLRQILT